MARIYNELRSYQNIPRELVFDKTLSDRARFVYVFMACKPDDWDFFLEPMSKEIGYSIDTLRKYLNELVASGWLVKGEQSNERGVFGAVEYIIKATKITDTENFRHGKKPIQDNIDNIITDKREKKDKNKEENSKKEELFEECWIAYNRKGSKKKSLEQWIRLKDAEKNAVLRHVKLYVTSRERQYQKDFERYLRDKTFNDVVMKGNSVVYDPTIGDSDEYRPQESFDLHYNEYQKCYMYTGMFFSYLADGYTDDNRPDGATIKLNNARGTMFWSASDKKWKKEK